MADFKCGNAHSNKLELGNHLSIRLNPGKCFLNDLKPQTATPKPHSPLQYEISYAYWTYIKDYNVVEGL
jgi:hypothetical protein